MSAQSLDKTEFLLSTQHSAILGFIRAEMMNMKPSASLLEEIASLLDSGQLKTVVAQTFSLSEARQAQELSQGGDVQGKIVLQINA
ncbi:zinc-binding dehydrogenase [Nostoc sp.]|uniref:zinc-binding dehydrogenase n=1 Tax=Nostoc sp. TaxID=1180 RepID=UPI002FF53015